VANRSWKLCAIILLLTLPSLPLRAGRSPVLTRTGSGRLVLKRGAASVAPGEAKHARAFPFDRPSTRGLIRGAGRARGPLGASGNGVDTIRVVLVRVSFETDREDRLSSLSTGGDFDLAANGAALIDPSPHNRDYFDSHMKALRNYYWFQSCGRLEIVWDVLPKDEDASYKLSDLADYGPGASGSWRTASLVRLFREGVQAADRALAAHGYPERFGDYDAVILAHAGANLQSDINGDTPNDVPSFFATLTPADTFTVDGGATTIRDGSVVPETATQDGFNGGISGVIAHEFGHQLGLGDLYNTDTGTPAVGYWDLMDTGSYLGAYMRDREGNLQYVEGFLPGGLSAWPRTVLGWTTVDTVATLENAVRLRAAERCPARVVLVEAASDEYFLVENRSAELDGIATEYVIDASGVIIGTANATDSGTSGAAAALVNGYDLLLPQEFDSPSPVGGPGVLIWHVDERLVAQRLSENVLNVRRPFAVSLLEANGVIDLGDPSSRYAYGWYDDAYYAGNATVLSDSTLPAGWSTWGVPTGVRVDHISARDTLMSLDVRVRGVKASRSLPNRGGAAEIASMVLPDGSLLAIDALGRGWLAGTEAPVISIGRPFVTIPALAHRSGSGEPDGIVAGDRDGYLHKIKIGQWDEFEGWPAFIAGSFVSHPVVFTRDGESFVAAVDRSSRIHLIGPSGLESRGSPLILSNHSISNIVVSQTRGEGSGLFLVVGDADPLRAWLVKLSLFPGQSGDAFGYADGYPKRLLLDAEDVAGGVYLVGGDIVPEQEGDEVYVVCRLTGRILCCGSHGVIAERHRERLVAAPPALFDLNGDSYLDLVYSDGISVYAIGPSGANLTGWPRDPSSFRALPWEARVGTPLTVLGSGSEGTVVAGSDGGLLYLVRGSGEILRDFPRKVSGPMDHAIEVWDGGNAPYLVLRDGPLAKWREAPAVDGGWLTLWGDDSRTAWALRSTVKGSAGKWLAERGDFVVYPNPSRGDRIGFHFVAPREGTAHLEILTLAGELVLERDKQMAGGEDEFVVSMKDKASGVYLCRLVIASEGRRVEANRMFAIVR